MTFWTCGPFKEIHDRIEVTNFKIEQQMRLQEILNELKAIDNLVENGDLDEKLLAALMKPDIEEKLNIILGIPTNGDGQTENNEVLGETIRKSLSRISKK
tara:strand:- start:1633 stop:1932 length:300 start_codon:yes stop_codon:yes gene_type:complete